MLKINDQFISSPEMQKLLQSCQEISLRLESTWLPEYTEKLKLWQSDSKVAYTFPTLDDLVKKILKKEECKGELLSDAEDLDMEKSGELTQIHQSTPTKTERDVPKRGSAEKAKGSIKNYYLKKQGMHPSKSEGEVERRRDVLSKSGEKNEAPLENLRVYFDAIVKQLSKEDKTKRVRYIRKSEQPITLQDIIDLGNKCDREIGIYLDKYKLDPSKRNTDKYTKNDIYTPICLYAGNKISNQHRGDLRVGAAVSFPPGGTERYRIVAHTHPTESSLAEQITNDMQQATDDIEIVVNRSKLILYYKQTLCLNVSAINSQGLKYYKAALKSNFMKQYEIGINTGISVEIINNLNSLIPPGKSNAKVAATEPEFSDLNPLWSDDINQFKFEEEADEEGSESELSSSSSSPSLPSFTSLPMQAREQDSNSYTKTKEKEGEAKEKQAAPKKNSGSMFSSTPTTAEKPKTRYPRISLFQYRCLTGLDIPVSNNFGIVEDPPRKAGQQGEKTFTADVNKK